MKKLMILILTILFCLVSLAGAQEKGPQAKPGPCAYTGTVKEKLEHPDRIVLQTQVGPKDFLFVPASKEEKCITWQNIAVGSSVTVTCKEERHALEAACVEKGPAGATFQGGTIQGGKIN